MKNVRLLERDEMVEMRKEANKVHMRAKRASSVSYDDAIALFLSKIKCGPDYVCRVCHRMLYKSSVILLNESKYVKGNVLNNVEKYRRCSVDDKEWICRSCNNAMCKGNMPVQAKANGLALHMKDLNTLELCMVSLRIPFMNLVALPSGKQRSIHGPAVNVPSKLDTVCSLLPRMPNEVMIPLKLKRKFRYKDTIYMIM